MTNKELFQTRADYEVEENLGYLLQIYWDKVKEKIPGNHYLQSPINPVSFVKEFLKEETYVNTDISDRLQNQNNDIIIIDGEYREI